MTVRRMASVYEFADRLVVIAAHRTDAGFWRAGEPVIRLALSVPDEALGVAIQRALAEAPARVAATPWKEIAPVLIALARSAGFRSWAPFDRRACLCSVRESSDGALTVAPMRHGGTRGPDKGFHEQPDREFIVTASDASALGAAARRGLTLSSGPCRRGQPDER